MSINIYYTKSIKTNVIIFVIGTLLENGANVEKIIRDKYMQRPTMLEKSKVINVRRWDTNTGSVVSTYIMNNISTVGQIISTVGAHMTDNVLFLKTRRNNNIDGIKMTVNLITPHNDGIPQYNSLIEPILNRYLATSTQHTVDTVRHFVQKFFKTCSNITDVVVYYALVNGNPSICDIKGVANIDVRDISKMLCENK